MSATFVVGCAMSAARQVPTDYSACRGVVRFGIGGIDNQTWSFTPAHGGRIEFGSGDVEQEPGRRDDYLPPEIALFFPLSMRTRGETADAFRLAGTEVEGVGVRLAHVPIEDPHFTVLQSTGSSPSVRHPPGHIPSGTSTGSRGNGPDSAFERSRVGVAVRRP